MSRSGGVPRREALDQLETVVVADLAVDHGDVEVLGLQGRLGLRRVLQPRRTRSPDSSSVRWIARRTAGSSSTWRTRGMAIYFD